MGEFDRAFAFRAPQIQAATYENDGEGAGSGARGIRTAEIYQKVFARHRICMY